MQQTLHVIAVNLGGMLSHTTQHDTQIQTLNATDIACHSCEAGAMLSNTTQPSTQTLSTVDITCHNHEPLSLHEKIVKGIHSCKPALLNHPIHTVPTGKLSQAN